MLFMDSISPVGPRPITLGKIESSLYGLCYVAGSIGPILLGLYLR